MPILSAIVARQPVCVAALAILATGLDYLGTLFAARRGCAHLQAIRAGIAA